MKKEIILGHVPFSGENLTIDIEALLASRLLIQSNSGGGKSWLIRRLAEQLFGKVPVIIIDIEGEFASLREKFGYVLVGKGGETPADVRSAQMVAHKLLELRASAVCDLYELKPQVRHQWVRLFLEAVIDAPKQLWGPTVFVIDEAHQFCPEGKSGESEASGAVVDLATRGRKRGFCAVLATQRLGKLRKDAAAELLNVLIGMTFIDVDRERAAECLGISREERKKFNADIKLLTAGNFYALGRALCRERTLINVGKVSTTHPEAGVSKFAMIAPPVPKEIQSMLPKLADLPKQAEEKAKTEADLRKEIRDLKFELAKKPNPVTETEKIPALDDSERKRLEKLIEVLESYELRIADIKGAVTECFETINQNASYARAEATFFKLLLSERLKALPTRAGVVRTPCSNSPRPVATPKARTVPTFSNGSDGAGVKIQGGMRRMMIALAQRGALTKRQLGVRAGLSSTSGTFGTYLSTLRTQAWIEDLTDGTIRLTPEGGEALGDYEPLPEGKELFEYWVRDMGDSGAARILIALYEAYPNPLTKAELGEAANISHTSGTFGTYLSKLRTLELITGKGELLATSEFFE